MHGHFLYVSNGNFLSQKEQVTLVGAELPGGVGAGVDSVASSSVDPLFFFGLIVGGIIHYSMSVSLQVDFLYYILFC